MILRTNILHLKHQKKHNVRHDICAEDAGNVHFFFFFENWVWVTIHPF